MKRPTFLEGVGVALAASIVGSISFTVLTAVFSEAHVLRLLIAGVSVAYVVYLLRRSHEHIGRISALAMWAVVAGATWVMDPPLLIYALVHLALIWLIRSLYFYSSVVSALADLGLSGLGLAATVWAASQSGSLFLSIWCFFLVQALFVAIPTCIEQKGPTIQTDRHAQDLFQDAYRSAEASLRALSSIR